MPKPLATTKQSVPDHSALIELFQRLGQSSLDKAIAAQVDCEFYKALLKRVKADEPVAEFKGIPKAKVTKTLEGLITKTERAQLEAWNLPVKAQALLDTTVQTFSIKDEPIPCYDVLYETGSGRDAVKIRITTRRRLIEVTFQGAAARVDAVSGRLVLLMLKP
jgi:hypothetical protein